MTDDLRNMRDPDATRDMTGDPLRDTGLGATDETRRADDLAPTGQDAPAGAPAGQREWDRTEWEGENQPHGRTGRKLDESARTTLDDAVTGEPKWNEHEFVGEGQGGPNEGPNERVIPTEGDNEFSGHGHNPGGGERWADVDRGPEDSTDATRRVERDV